MDRLSRRYNVKVDMGFLTSLGIWQRVADIRKNDFGDGIERGDEILYYHQNPAEAVLAVVTHVGKLDNCLSALKDTVILSLWPKKRYRGSVEVHDLLEATTPQDTQ